MYYDQSLYTDIQYFSDWLTKSFCQVTIPHLALAHIFLLLVHLSFTSDITWEGSFTVLLLQVPSNIQRTGQNLCVSYVTCQAHIWAPCALDPSLYKMWHNPQKLNSTKQWDLVSVSVFSWLKNYFLLYFQCCSQWELNLQHQAMATESVSVYQRSMSKETYETLNAIIKIRWKKRIFIC